MMVGPAHPERLDTRWLKRLCWAAFGVRFFVSAMTVVPARDGVNYLWMSERLLAGDATSALAEVFPPGWPLLMAPFVAFTDLLGMEAFRGAQIANAVYGALALWPTLRIAEMVGPRVVKPLAWLLILSPLSVRFGAEAMSETTTHLMLAFGLWATVTKRYLLAGVFAALAFAIRPEAGALAGACLLADPRRGWKALIPVAVVTVLLGWWRQSAGYGFTPIPKLAFHEQNDMGALTGESIDLGELGRNLRLLPWLFIEGLQALAVVALVGLYHAARRRRAHRLGLFRIPLLSLAIAAVSIVLFITKRRFFVPWIPAIAIFASYGLARLGEQARRGFFILAMIFSILGCLRLQPDDRYAERTIGKYLERRLPEGQRVDGDQPRLIYFSGCRPTPPRHFDADELVERALDPRTRYVVLTNYKDRDRPNPITEEVVRRLEGVFESHAMTEEARLDAEKRRLIVLERID